MTRSRLRQLLLTKATRVAGKVAWSWAKKVLLAKASLVIVVILAVLIGAWIALAVAYQAAANGTSRAAGPAAIPGLDNTVLDAVKKAAGNAGTLAPGCVIRWSLLAGIGQIESNNAAGRTVRPDGTVDPPIYGPRLDGSGIGGNTTPFYDTDNGAYDADTEYDRAVGYLQFIPSTWKSAGRDGNGDGVAHPQNVYDAAAAAVVLLCGNGPVDLTNRAAMASAIYRYNHSHDYVTKVMAAVDRFDTYGDAETIPAGSAGPAVEKAIAFAEQQLGKPYVWGGNGPDGWDCSGLTKAAYASAGITIMRVANDQYAQGPDVAGARDGLGKLQRGDLLFWNYTTNPRDIHHVALYLGGGKMIEAPTFGIPVRIRDVYWENFFGATRPSAR